MDYRSLCYCKVPVTSNTFKSSGFNILVIYITCFLLKRFQFSIMASRLSAIIGRRVAMWVLTVGPTYNFVCSKGFRTKCCINSWNKTRLKTWNIWIETHSGGVDLKAEVICLFVFKYLPLLVGSLANLWTYKSIEQLSKQFFYQTNFLFSFCIYLFI